MSIEQNNIILASDVKAAMDKANSAISGLSVSGRTITYTKGDGTTGTITTQDNNTTYSASTGLSLSGTAFSLATVTTSGGTAGPTANATPAFGATFTVPKVVYDKYGRVTGHTNYTVKIPAAPAGANPKAYVTTTYRSGAKWYRVWSDGTIEQGGYQAISASSGTFTFPKAFTSTNYIVICQSTHRTGSDDDTSGWDDQPGLSNYTTTGFRYSANTNHGNFDWYAIGK